MVNSPRSPFILIRLPSLQLKELNELAIQPKVETVEDYAKHFQKIRAAIQKLAQNEDLLNGLLFSSHSFLDSVKKYFDKDPSVFNKKLGQIERRALGYLHRMTFNASPLSSFAKVQIRNEDWKYLKPKAPSLVLPNAQLINKFEQVLYKNKLLEEVLVLKVNPFIQHKEDLFSFIQFKGEQGIELIKLQSNDALFELYEAIRFKKSSLLDVQNELMNVLETDEEEALSVVLDLIKIQFLVPSWKTDDLGQADQVDLDVLVSNEHELKVMEKFKQSINNDQALNPILGLNDLEKINASQRFYEHCFDRREIENPNFDQKKIESEIIELYDMVHTCVREFDKNYAGLSLLEAFEIWDRKVRVRLDKVSLLNFDSHYELQLKSTPNSLKPDQLGIMIRRIPNYEKDLIVGWTSAYGKYVRRYLPNYQKEDLKEIKEWIKDSKLKLVQNIDKSLHPANELYDDLAHVELFSLQSDISNSEKIKLQLDIQGNLVDIRKGEHIEAIDLGIQNPQSRSSFYNFINHFGRYRNYLQLFLDEVSDIIKVEHEQYIHFPRIESPNLVLRMASWQFQGKAQLIGDAARGFQTYQKLQKLKEELSCSRLVSFHFGKGASEGYLDFDNPISVDSFARKVSKSEDPIWLKNITHNKSHFEQSDAFAEYYWEFKTNYSF